MDPVSIPALCLTSTKLLVGFYQYLSDIADAPRHVEYLATELSAFNFVLIRLKTLIASREESHKKLLEEWAGDSEAVLKGCCKTLQEIEALVVKSEMMTRKSVKSQVITCIKWNWNKEDVVKLRLSLENYKSTISLMLQSLSGEQLDNITDTLEKLHKNVLEFQENRKYAKEVLEVMEEGHPHFNHPDVNISYNQNSPTKDQAIQTATENTKSQENQKTPQSSEIPHFRPLNKELLRDLESKSWTALLIPYASPEHSPISPYTCEMKIVIRDGKVPCLEIYLHEDHFDHLCRQYSHYFDSFISNIQRIRRAPQPGGISAVSTFLGAPPVEVGKSSNLLGWLAYHPCWEPGPFPLYFRTFRTGKIYFEFAFFDIDVHNRMSTITLTPGKYTHPERAARGGLQLRFEHVGDRWKDVEAVGKLLTAVKTESESSWVLHAQAFASLDPTIKSGDVEKGQKSWENLAAEEEFKWSMYIRACLDDS